ncbi:HAD-IIIA family hydrolase [Clostridium sp. HBUAS56017]|uniref:HAD-IIIA family hydrolase n=1 Tax=Clostridium sp. HBUAS56017 TaxID=2571128 RepID=UPI001177536B|nr:HAD-IIIA family hydrolase [Clostridium sp. HBUAS56017]
MTKSFKAVFIDRDGTIGGSGDIVYPKDFEVYKFTLEAIKLLKEFGFKVFGFSNQPGISSGNSSEEEFYKQLISFGLDDAYICPHTDEMNCECRKPKAGMLYRASKEYNLDLKKCIVIGDSWRDMLAAHNGGVKKILVKTGNGKDDFDLLRLKFSNVNIDYYAENLLDAVKWII